MTKKQLHTALRKLKKELDTITNFNDYVSLSLKGHKVTQALFDKGISKTDMKLILAWESKKEIVRSQVIRNRAA